MHFLWILTLLVHFIRAQENDGSGEEPMVELPVIHTAFVQTGNELHYFSESSSHEAQLFSGGHIRSSSKKWVSGEDGAPITFDPPTLDFGDQSIGVPSVRRVRVRATIGNIELVSIMASTVNFHSSFFDKRVLSTVDEDAWLEIAFLAREEGKVASQLFIHTSEGIVHYQVSGTGAHNPYRLRPFVGIRLPLNATVARPLSIHNPYAHTLKVKEITTSGGDIHVSIDDVDPLLTMPPSHSWEIRPFETRNLGNVFVIGANEQNTTSFVKIIGQIDEPSVKEEHEIFLSFPLEVSRKKGVFPSMDLLDFGLLKHGEKSRQLVYSVFSSLGRNIDFETLYVDKGDATGIYMEFASNPPIRVPSSKQWVSDKSTDLVKVTFDSARLVLDKKKPQIKRFLGRIYAVSRGGNYNVTIPYTASVYTGTVEIADDDLCLHNGIRPPYKRGVRLRNALPFGVAIWNVTVAAELQQFMTVRLFERVSVLRPQESRAVFLLKYNKRVPDGFQSFVTVQTNITNYKLPVRFFEGNVEVDLYALEQNTFDFGLVEKNDTRSIRFEVRNSNPAHVWLRGIRVNTPEYLRLRKVGWRKMNDTAVTSSKQLIAQGDDISVPPGSLVVFDLWMRVPMDAEDGTSELHLDTDWETRIYSVTYKIATGSLLAIPEEVDFGKTHPGRVSYRNLKVFNAFTTDMTITRMSSLERDPRIHFDGFDPLKPPVLRSGRVTNIGRVLFHPDATCPANECYLGVHLPSPDGQWFVHGLSLPSNLADIDSYLYRRARARYDALVAADRHYVNSTISIDTTHAKNIHVPVRAELVWPRLLTRNSVHFPLTALGNFTIINLTLANPSALPVVVQIIPLVIYPDADAVVHLFRDTLLTPLTNKVEMNETLMFSLRDTELFTLKPDSPVPQLREELERSLNNMSIPRFTLSMILKPHMKVRIRLGFLPSDYTLRSSLLLIRNNLTVIEPVVVYGRGARIGMQVGGSEARSRQPLLFEIRHDHLADCNNPKRLMHKLTSTLTVRRPFLIQNTGEVPWTVVNMSISGIPCENRGFKILNCYPFRLAPNETYSLDVAYTPDFLATVNDADLQLYMHMNGSAWVYHIAATVPKDMLSRCHAALPRPPFENLMYYSCVTALVFCLVCVVACAYLEGDRAITCAIREHYAQQRTVFDLNNLTPEGKPRAASANASNEKSFSSKPSGLQVADDAGTMAKAFYNTANTVIHLVHRLWRVSLLLRSAKESEPIAPAKKKKRGPVLAAKFRELREREKQKDRDGERAEGTVTQTGGGRKIQPVAPLPNPQHTKLTAKPSVSPKTITKPANKKKDERSTNTVPPTQHDGERKKSVQERERLEKERVERERRLQRKTELIDDEQGTRPDISSRRSDNNDDFVFVTSQNQKTKVPSRVASDASIHKRRTSDTSTASSGGKATATVAPVPSSSRSSRKGTTPMVQEVAPLVQAANTLSSQQNMPSTRDSSVARSMRDVSPAPSMASIASMVSMRIRAPTPPPTPRENTPEPGAMARAGSETALSEVSDIPEWDNEQVDAFGCDADDDFSALAGASAKLFTTGYESGTSSTHGVQGGGGLQGNKKRKRGRRGRRSRKVSGGSESSVEQFNKSHGSSSSSVGKPSRLIQEVTEDRRRQEAQYTQQLETSLSAPLTTSNMADWPMPQFHLSSLLEHENGGGSTDLRMWPPTPLTAGGLDSLPLLSDTFGSMPLSGTLADPMIPGTSSDMSSMGLGFDLGYSLFPDMTWTNAQVDPEQAWASFTAANPHRSAKKEEKEEDKKND